jgi:hypothetical protein
MAELLRIEFERPDSCENCEFRDTEERRGFNCPTNIASRGEERVKTAGNMPQQFTPEQEHTKLQWDIKAISSLAELAAACVVRVHHNGRPPLEISSAMDGFHFVSDFDNPYRGALDK